jgi:hypothetical protein
MRRILAPLAPILSNNWAVPQILTKSQCSSSNITRIARRKRNCRIKGSHGCEHEWSRTSPWTPIATHGTNPYQDTTAIQATMQSLREEVLASAHSPSRRPRSPSPGPFRSRSAEQQLEASRVRPRRTGTNARIRGEAMQTGTRASMPSFINDSRTRPARCIHRVGTGPISPYWHAGTQYTEWVSSTSQLPRVGQQPCITTNRGPTNTWTYHRNSGPASNPSPELPSWLLRREDAPLHARSGAKPSNRRDHRTKGSGLPNGTTSGPGHNTSDTITTDIHPYWSLSFIFLITSINNIDAWHSTSISRYTRAEHFAPTWQSTQDWLCAPFSCAFIFNRDGTLDFPIISKIIYAIQGVSGMAWTDSAVSHRLLISWEDSRTRRTRHTDVTGDGHAFSVHKSATIAWRVFYCVIVTYMSLLKVGM